MQILEASSEPGFFTQENPSKYDRNAIGLSLSGGGYRATLFHTGVVIRLNELKLLPRLARVSSVSGGSITSGLLAARWNELAFDQDGFAENLNEVFVRPALALTARTLDVRTIVAGYLPTVSAGNHLARLYDKYAFKGLELRQLPATPRFIFNASNLQTGGLFRFTRNYLADWRVLYCENHKVKLSEAVAASSAFPPFLAPLRLDLRRESVQFSKQPRFTDPALHRRPVLVDGGVYDNLGLEPIWKRCGVLIASYAGYNLEARSGNFNVSHLVRTVMTFLASSIDWRERVMIGLGTHTLPDTLPERRVAYWTAETDIAKYPARDGWRPDPDIFETAKTSPTRLKALGRAEQTALIYAGYAYADAAVRSYVVVGAPPPADAPSLPFDIT